MRYLIVSLLITVTAAWSPDTPADAATPATGATGESRGSLHMTVMDVFRIQPGGVAISGKIDAGILSSNGTLCLHSAKAGPLQLTIMALSAGGKPADSAGKGAQVGVTVSGVETGQVSKGDTITLTCD